MRVIIKVTQQLNPKKLLLGFGFFFFLMACPIKSPFGCDFAVISPAPQPACCWAFCGSSHFPTERLAEFVCLLACFPLFFVWPHHMPCAIVAPQPVDEPMPSVLEGQSLNH